MKRVAALIALLPVLALAGQTIQVPGPVVEDVIASLVSDDSLDAQDRKQLWQYNQKLQSVGNFDDWQTCHTVNIPDPADVTPTFLTPGNGNHYGWGDPEPVSNAVPIPGALLLVGLGTVGVGLLRSRRNRG